MSSSTILQSKALRYAAACVMTIVCVSCSGAPNPATKHVQLICHRTANKDLPENTLESLEQAALLGCDVVEVDVRKTLDGKLVLNHDGFLERLTDGIGEVEQTYFDDLRLRDEGGWMGERFKGMQIPLFDDALRMAKDLNIELFLDLKDKGIGADVLRSLRREGMLDRVRFGGEWDDVKRLYPEANESDSAASVEPGVTAKQVNDLHRESKVVVANFSANGHEMDFAAMNAAVAAGVDGISVDYPRLGADAIGRPVERKLAELAAKANAGDSVARRGAILALSRYRGFDLDDDFARWLLDPDKTVSRAAALALVMARPLPQFALFKDALVSDHADARAYAAWALGTLGAPASMLTPLLRDNDGSVRLETLIALAHTAGYVSASDLLPLMSDPNPPIRGAASLALARHQPDVAEKAIPLQLQSEVKDMTALHDAWLKRGQTPLTQSEIDMIVLYYRCQVKEVLALSMLKSPASTSALEDLAFRPGKDFSEMNGILASFQLWDRIAQDAQRAAKTLNDPDNTVADRAEWILVHGGSTVLPDIRAALRNKDPQVRDRAIQIVAWQGDVESIPILRELKQTSLDNKAAIDWAIERIQMLRLPR